MSAHNAQRSGKITSKTGSSKGNPGVSRLFPQAEEGQLVHRQAASDSYVVRCKEKVAEGRQDSGRVTGDRVSLHLTAVVGTGTLHCGCSESGNTEVIIKRDFKEYSHGLHQALTPGTSR